MDRMAIEWALPLITRNSFSCELHRKWRRDVNLKCGALCAAGCCACATATLVFCDSAIPKEKLSQVLPHWANAHVTTGFKSTTAVHAE